MKKKIIKWGIIVSLLILFVIPVRISFHKDGGSISFSPLVRWYVIWNLNEIHAGEPLLSHDDPNYNPVQGYYIKGTRIEVLGQEIYEDTYEVHK